MTANVKFIVGATAINKAIDSIATRGAKLDKDIQLAALSVIKHHADHGDFTLTNRLVDNMPKGSRVNALREFIERFSGMAFDKETKQFVHVKGKKADLQGASEVMWTSFKPEAGYTPIEDPVKLVEGIIAKLEKDRKELGDKSRVDPALIAALRAAKPLNAVAA